MPIYVFKCAKCAEVIEDIRRTSDPDGVHEGCGGALTKQPTCASFQFKGTGFYCTDYKKPSRLDSK